MRNSTTILLFFLIYGLTLMGQNLIYNPSFEEYTELPTGISQLNRAKGWFPTHISTTSDYYNNQGAFSVGFPAQDGFGYAGIGLFNSDSINTYREYLSTKLIKSLEVGQFYRLSFYVNSHLGITQGVFSSLDFGYSNGIQFLLTEDTLKQAFSNDNAIIANTPVLFSAPVNTNDEWQKVSASFVADKAYNFITFGNFLNFNQTQLDIFYRGNNRDSVNRIEVAYYFFDNFVLEKVRQPITGDTLYQVCKGDEIELKVHGDSLNKWYNSKKQLVAQNIESFIIQPDSSTNYTVIGRTDTLEIKVEVKPKPQASYTSQTLCFENSLDITPTNLPFYDSLAINPIVENYNLKEQGTYFLEYFLGNCIEKDTIEVQKIDCEVVLEYPNVFTPNGDGKNEFFVPQKQKNIGTATLRIYNRWGKEIFKTEDLAEGWDGAGVDSGVYYYHVEYQDIFGKENAIKGWVLLQK